MDGLVLPVSLFVYKSSDITLRCDCGRFDGIFFVILSFMSV